MKELLEIIQTWSGIFLLLVLAVIGIICSLAGSSSGEERKLAGTDDDHYVLRLPISRVVYPLMMLIIGAVLQFVCNYVQNRFFPEMVWPFFAGKLVLGFIFGLLFWTQLAKVLRSRVFVNGEKIVVTPAIGAPIETNFKQIRTVANKLAGRDRGVIGKKIRTKEGNRFEVINTMAGYERFCIQLEEKVELPNLTKKLFKKRDKKASPEKEPEEVVSHDPLPQASPSVYMPVEKPASQSNASGTHGVGSLYHKLESFVDAQMPGLEEEAEETEKYDIAEETSPEERTEEDVEEYTAGEKGTEAEETVDTETQETEGQWTAAPDLPEIQQGNAEMSADPEDLAQDDAP